MKRINHNSSAFLIIISIIIASLMVSSFGCAKKEEKEIKLGAILPLTGDAALAGINTREGIELAVEEINKDGLNGGKIKVIYEDTQADSKTAVSAVNKLINIDRVQYIIDDSVSSLTLAVAPIVEKNKVVLLSTGATAPKISQIGDFVFRIWNSDALEGEEIAKYAIDVLEKKHIGILYINNDYGVGLTEVFQTQLTQKGLTPVRVESFEQGAQEHHTQLAKVLSANPEAIYLVGYSKDCIRIIQQAKEMKFKGVWLGTTVMLDPSVSDVVEKNKYKLYYPSPTALDVSLPSTKVFRESFLRKYKKEAPALADVGYDAVILFKKAVEYGNGLNGENIRSGLMKLKPYEGASGSIEFDMNGDVHKPIEIKLLP